MQRLFLRAGLFLTANFLLVLLHIHLFQGAWPFAAWWSLGAHGLALLLFPYKRVFA